VLPCSQRLAHRPVRAAARSFPIHLVLSPLGVDDTVSSNSLCPPPCFLWAHTCCPLALGAPTGHRTGGGCGAPSASMHSGCPLPGAYHTRWPHACPHRHTGGRAAHRAGGRQGGGRELLPGCGHLPGGAGVARGACQGVTSSTRARTCVCISVGAARLGARTWALTLADL